MDSLDLEQEKKALRIAMNKRRLAVTPPCAERLARIAGERLLAEQAWKKATSVGLYFSVRGELDSKELLKAAWAEGKEVLLPRSLPGRPGIMELLPCSGFEALVPGLFGIMEPDPARCPSPSEGSRIPELLVVPGLAFDRGGTGWAAGAAIMTACWPGRQCMPCSRWGTATPSSLYPGSLGALGICHCMVYARIRSAYG